MEIPDSSIQISWRQEGTLGSGSRATAVCRSLPACHRRYLRLASDKKGGLEERSERDMGRHSRFLSIRAQFDGLEWRMGRQHLGPLQKVLTGPWLVISSYLVVTFLAHQSFTFVLQQVENVFDQLITKIEAAYFDPRPLMKRWNTLDRYEPIKRRCCSLVVHQAVNVITHYLVIDDKTCEKRLWQMKRLDRGNKFYLCEVSSNMVVDATYKGNMSRFINHSCEPDTEMQKWTIDGETRVGIFALRDIKKGEELTYDSNFVQFGKNQDCHCGSSNCRKTLGKAKMVNSFILNKGNSGSSQNQHIKKKQKKSGDLNKE
nr:unnamed protein product [Digitaria exilis]